MIPFRPTRFARKSCLLSFNLLLTFIDGIDALARLGPRVLREGAKDVVFAVRA
jgi:hypothetical protein